MYGNSGKYGRGGGGGGRGGAPKRGLHTPLPPPPAPHRPSGCPRPIGNRHGGPGPRPAPPAPEETFSLVSSDPLAFGMIIRLTPDLVEEIRRVEAQGGTARIKFDSNPNNSSGNVIEVGGKDFRFTWSREMGDCDIYEERRSGEDGNGLLVESGSAWRKLNVQRILDESTKNHVKMRSEEAERQLKSRKAIVLDPANPSVKNQAKTMAAAAVESNMRRMPFKPKKEPAFKKRKVEASQVPIAGPPKSVFKSGISSTTPAKSRLSVSPLPSPPEQPVASASPFGVGNLSRIQTAVEEVNAPKVTNREDAANPEKEVPSSAVHAAAGEVSRNKKSGATPMDLRNTLITLLMRNPKGMSLKALEKAVGDTNPNSGWKIETIIKKIATFQAPGRYFLNQGVEMESFKKPSSESGSSPECTGDQTPVAESTFLEKHTVEEFEQQTQLNSNVGEESNVIEKIDTQRSSPDHFASDKKVSNNGEGKVGSSSESGSESDSDSDSSDSGSDSESQSRSRSRSKSRSPAGSGSASSSDSESDGSSSSKEGSDVDVDIMTSDDEKEEAENKLQAPESKLSTLPSAWRSGDGHDQNGNDKNRQDGQVLSSALDLNDVEKYDDMSDAVDIDDLPIDNNIKAYQNHETEVDESSDWVPQVTNNRSSEEGAFSPERYKQSDTQRVSLVGNFVNDASDQTMKQKANGKQTSGKDSVGHEQPDNSARISKSKSKRASDPNRFQEKPESAKRLRAKSLAPDPYRENSMQMSDKFKRDGNADSDPQKGYGLAVPGRSSAYENAHRTQMGSDFMNASVSDTQQSTQKSGDYNARGKAPDVAERSGKYVENLGKGSKYSERFSALPDESDESALKNIHSQDKIPMPKDKLHKDRQDEDGDVYEKSFVRNVRESAVGDKLSVLSDSHYRKSGEQSGKYKDGGQIARLHMASLHKDYGKPDTDKGSMLRREPSELELGEFREPASEETQGTKRQFEKKNSFKSVENKPNSSDILHSDLGKGRPVGKAIQESKKQSPLQSNQDGLFRKRVPEDDLEDSARPQQRTATAQIQQFPRIDRAGPEAGPQLDRMADIATKARKNEARANQGTGLESHASTQRKVSTSLLQQHDPKNGVQMGSSNAAKETKPQRSNPVADSGDRRKDSFCLENTSGRKRRESSSDEDNSFYSKYDKDEPELKGAIKDYMQYKEYVQEYREKYDHYCSLNKSLENYRNDFHKLGCDLEHAKVRDMDVYHNILEQLKDTYRQCGTKHKWMKKIFVVLHEELKQLKQRIKDYVLTYSKD
ncbi:uncharacterized protein LOC131256127 [Magnolia sinica]|uniref:uncharacterized protein LOC131256127 n=1 Tax=Magnolia sinica TaxID=86752 RepID=UPI002659CE7E|nr:uncharacterized protein LOC131256127 [Magnolia sinica]